MKKLGMRALVALLVLVPALGMFPAHASRSVSITYAGPALGPTIACGLAAPAPGVGGGCIEMKPGETSVSFAVTDALSDTIGGWAYWAKRSTSDTDNLLGLYGFTFCGSWSGSRPPGVQALVVVLYSSPLHTCTPDNVPTTGTIKATVY